MLTHGHNDHINAAGALSDETDAPIFLHPADTMLWEAVYPDRSVDRTLADGDVLTAGGVELGILHTPGHSPGCCCLHHPSAGVVFSGDTLFCGGPGATGRSFSDEATILESVQSYLDAGLDGMIFNLPDSHDLEPVEMAGAMLSKVLLG